MISTYSVGLKKFVFCGLENTLMFQILPSKS